jgi:hypothetical protein
MKKSRDLAEAICISLLVEPESWQVGYFTLDHKSGVKVWIANIPWFDLHKHGPGEEIGFGMWGRLKVWRSIRRWRHWERLHNGTPVDPARRDIEKLLRPLVDRNMT